MIRTATAEYVPSNPDEIAFNKGDQILLKQVFDDGWALGVNQSTGMEGMLPLTFVTQ